ncbi:MAG TPA: serine hydrolase domain-containing protein [Ilumatobacteraceae bacterium]|nr:serine hydrolase domain-containing protein [Ilumatobacteraceae bacterium]
MSTVMGAACGGVQGDVGTDSSPAPPISVAAPGRDQSGIQAALDDFVAGSGSPGGIASVQVGTMAPTIVTAGLSDRRTGTPMVGDERFYTGKIGGLFVTTVALQLVAEGRLDLDAPVGSLLAGAPRGDLVTVRHLLEHTSGFDDWFGDGDLTVALEQVVAADPDRRVTSDEIIELMRDRPLAFEPGTAAQHAEFNTLLLRLVIETIESKEFGRILEERIIERLGLRDTAYGFDAVPPSELLPGLLRVRPDPTDQWTTEYEGAAFVTTFYAAAPITSTAGDLMRFGDALHRTDALVPRDLSRDAEMVNEFGSSLRGIALTEDGVCVMLVDCAAGTHEYVGFGQPSLALGAYSGLFYDRTIDALTFVLVNNTGTSIRPLYQSVRAAI